LNQPIAIQARDICVTYQLGSVFRQQLVHHALNSISFEVKAGENFGVLGRNGCGKSTLLRLLAGVVKPDSGTLIVNNINSRHLMTLGLGFDNELTGRDNALLSMMMQGLKKKDAQSRLDEIETFSELDKFFRQPVRTYSAGMRARLGFAVAIQAKTELLLLDETLSVGDQAFKQKAEKVMLERLKGQQTVVFVSHNAEQVNKLCDHCIWIEQGEIKAAGDTKSVSKLYREFMNKLNS